MTSLMRPPKRTTARRREWYVTAAHGTFSSTAEETTRVPTADVHVKRLGETRTACGVSTLNWKIFWLENPYRTVGLCRDCAEAIETPAART